MNLLNKKTKKEFYISLDIRSSSIGVSIYTKDKDNIPTILYSDRNFTVINNAKNITLYKKTIFKLLNDTLDEMIQKGIKKINSDPKKEISIKEINCVFSSPWYDPVIENVHLKGENELFTKKDFEEILERGGKFFQNSEEISVIENNIISSYLNGYEVNNPFDKKVSDLSISFYISLMDTNIKTEILNIIKDKISAQNINLYTHPFVLISTIKYIYHTLDNFILLDLSGEITEISLYKKNKLYSISSIPIGNNFFINEIMSNFNLNKNNAISLLSMYSDDKLDKNMNKNIIKIINESVEKWSDHISNSIKKDWEHESIPSNIFVTTDLNFEKFVKNILLDRKIYNSSFKISKEPRIQVMDRQVINNLSIIKKTNQPIDPMIYIITYFSTILDN